MGPYKLSRSSYVKSFPASPASQEFDTAIRLKQTDHTPGITAEYNCFFGIADEIPSLVPGNSHVSNDIDHSSLLFVGQGPKTITNAGTGGLPQWFFFSKMDRKYTGSSIPRFTQAQMKQQVEEFGDFKLSEHVTLKEIMKKTRSLSYLPLEEANHEVWTYGRIVCLGDAIHKMTPNVGTI